MVIVPNWPKIHELEFWKSQVTLSIVIAAASGDLDHDAWTAWIAPTFAPAITRHGWKFSKFR